LSHNEEDWAYMEFHAMVVKDVQTEEENSALVYSDKIKIAGG